MNKIILPIIRKLMPTILAQEIIGIQPMTGPVGQIFSLRSKYNLPLPLEDVSIFFPKLGNFLERNQMYAVRIDNLDSTETFDNFVYIKDFGDKIDLIESWFSENMDADISGRVIRVYSEGECIGDVFCFNPDEINQYLLFKLTWA